jgi:hypothetical protein
MAIRIITVSEPVHKPPAVDKLKAAPDRKAYKREWMRRYRVEERADAVRLALVD